MATHDYVIANQGFPAFRSDLNSVLQAIVSNNSNATAPSTTYAYQMWYETDTNNWYMRNADNDAWITLATFNQTNDTVNFIDSSSTVAGISTSASATVITLANGVVAINPAGYVSVGGAATQSGEIRFLEDTDNGANYVAVKSPTANVAGANFTLTLPEATDTLIGKTTTDTLTNKTLTSPKINENVAVTSTATELNILDGVTSTTAELNILDGVTSTAAELNYSDLATLGTSAASKVLTANANNLTTISGAVLNTEDALTDASSIVWNVINSPVVKVTLTANRAMAAPTGTGIASGQFISLLVIQDAGGTNTITWNAVYEFPSDTAPTLTSTGNLGDLFSFRYNGAKWLLIGQTLALTLS